MATSFFAIEKFSLLHKSTIVYSQHVVIKWELVDGKIAINSTARSRKSALGHIQNKYPILP